MREDHITKAAFALRQSAEGSISGSDGEQAVESLATTIEAVAIKAA